MSFDGRVVLVTGAGRGLGLAYASTLAALGALVLIQDAGKDSTGQGSNPQVARDAADGLRVKGWEAFAVDGGIGSRAECHGLIAEALAIRGRLDGIIHNAGWVAYQPIEEVTDDAFDAMMAIAAKAPLWLAQAAWPAMLAAGFGRIVLTTSDRALYPEQARDGLAAYAAAKLAAVGIVNVLAREGAPHGIVVNALSPVAKTRMWGVEGEPEDLRPADVAPGAAFLVSDACTEGGWILRASNGQFHATRAVEAHGVEYPRNLCAVPARSVDEIAAAWPRIAIPAVEPRAQGLR